MCKLSRVMVFVILYGYLIVCDGKSYDYDFSNTRTIDLSMWKPRQTRLAVRSKEELDCKKPDIYFCEEPLDTLPSDSNKTCDYRNVNYHEQVYRWVAGRGCLLYTPDFLFLNGENTINLNAGCFYGNFYAPCLELAKPDGTCGCYPFDSSLEQVSSAIASALEPVARDRWRECYEQALQCCQQKKYIKVISGEPSCGVTFDGWTCWHGAKANSISTEVCSNLAYSHTGPSCYHFSQKACDSSGKWDLQTDYSPCSVSKRLIHRYRYHVTILSISLAASIPALIIFVAYDKLKISSIKIHRNLLISIIVRNTLVLISKSKIYMEEVGNVSDGVVSSHRVTCRVLAIIEKASINFVYMCLLVEGFYLHRLIVNDLNKQFAIIWLYVIGAIIAVAPVIIWSVIMSSYDANSCWMVETLPFNVQWTIETPRLIFLLINTVLYLDLLRVLMNKTRSNENKHQLKTVKITLFIIILFGIQFLLIVCGPNTTNCSVEEIYYNIYNSIDSLQGFVVAMLYCYINKEVHCLLKATYKKTEEALASRIEGLSIYPNSIIMSSEKREMTPTKNDPIKDQYASMKPKLHVAEIVSIEASEKLAEFLEPVYETIQARIANDTYNSLERIDNEDTFRPKRDSNIDDIYNFTKASSVSLECQDWIRCTSTSESIFENPLNERSLRFSENNSFDHDVIYEDINELNFKHVQNELKKDDNNKSDSENEDFDVISIDTSEDMLDGIMTCMKTTDISFDTTKEIEVHK